MYLKQVITHGFKSFADRITLTFKEDDITGIIGPNGSGKSNVIDAIRWVMGEQNTKNLRGEKSTDIIFNGSQRRKSLGMAEVSLVFDNSTPSSLCPQEYQHEPEITLTRRMFADGQRDFLINGQYCRLKDLIEFFVANNLGGRSYSMIQQGEVDRILQAKPEDLKTILEDSAGTAIFKRRRLETQKELNSTTQNLERINDLKIELEKQLETIREQAQKAKEWEELTKNLKEKETTLLRHNFRLFINRYNDLQQKQTFMTAQDANLVGKITTTEQELSAYKSKLATIDPHLSSINEMLTTTREQIASIQATLTNQQKFLEVSIENKKQLSVEQQEYQKSLDESIKEENTCSEKINHISADLSKNKNTLEDCYNQSRFIDEQYAMLNKKEQELQKEVQKADKIITSNKIKIDALEEQVRSNQYQTNQVTSHIITQENELSKIAILIDSTKLNKSQLEAKIDDLIESKHDIEISQQRTQVKQQEISVTADEIKTKLFMYKAELKNATTLVASTQKLKNFVKDIYAKKPELKSQVFVLSAQIKFNKKAHLLPELTKKAIDFWVERLIITSNAAIEHIQKIHASCPNKNILATVISNFKKIEHESKCYPLAHYLEFDHNNKNLSAVLNAVFYAPTQEGDFRTQLSAALAIFDDTGTIYSYQDIIFGSDTYIGKLKATEQVADITQKVKAQESSLNDRNKTNELLNTKIIELRRNAAVLNEQLDLNNKKLLEVSSEVKLQDHQLKQLQKDKDLKDEKIQALEEKSYEVEKKLQDLIASNQILSKEYDQANNDLKETSSALKALYTDKETADKDKNKLKIMIAQLQSEKKANNNTLSSIRLRTQKASQTLDRKKHALNNLSSQVEDTKKTNKSLEHKVTDLIQKKEELEQLLFNRKKENHELLQKLRLCNNELTSHQKNLHSLREDSSNTKFELDKLKINLQTIQETAYEKHRLTLDKEHATPIDDKIDTKLQSKQVSQLREKIANFGPINMMAIQEFRELTARFDFMTDQKNEIEKTVDLLASAISEIEQQTIQKLVNTLSIVNHEFKALFPILFPGGECSIIFTDDKAPLESGVEILVQLPGKKTQSMRLFSGGEKALTAIALILALLKTKPSPFCFLDEVDAALDETNVTRFNRLLRSLSNQFQFILITHRRRTMEILDTMYGITMQEPGVSKIVGVKLDESLPKHLQLQKNNTSAYVN